MQLLDPETVIAIVLPESSHLICVYRFQIFLNFFANQRQPIA